MVVSVPPDRCEQLEVDARRDRVALLDRPAVSVVVLPLPESDGAAAAEVDHAEAHAVVLDARAHVLPAAAVDADADAVDVGELGVQHQSLGAAEVVAAEG